ncbi:DUF2207 domain-containing protein [Neptunomonas phycophila]|uniref:DUF2207 domain-containing protein n=1 Tax=Neptunomonas phycophila TaxID=1572645 RepID=UPI003735F2AA
MQRFIKFPLYTLFIFFVSGWLTFAFAQERILDYQTDVTVLEDGTLLVTETIQVQAQGQQIKRGIYRDIPTTYDNPDGSRHHVDFILTDVTRDGQPENFHTKAQANGTRIYIGSQNVILPTARYTYQLRYQMKRMIQFGDNTDELFFNVIGTGFVFPIDRAKARIQLPENAIISDSIAYTGRQGSREHNANLSPINSHTIEVESSQPLSPYEGISLAVAWNKGVISEPTLADKLRWVWKDGMLILIAIAGFAATGLYLYFAWSKVGRDPSKDAIIARFTPPKDLSPAACQLILDRKYRPRGMAAALTNMVAKEYLSIEQSSKRVFTLTRIKESADLSPGEAILAARLFPSLNSKLTLNRTYNPSLKSATAAFKAKLNNEYGRTNFSTNRQYAIFGAFIAFVPLLAMILLSNNIEAVASSIFTIVATFILGQSVRKAVTQRSRPLILNILTNGVPVLFIIVMLNSFQQFGFFESAAAVAMITYSFCTTALLGLFTWLLEAPTVAGQKLVEQIEGFKLYLSVAEKDRLNFQHPPEMTLGLFEEYLPYAIALGVENEWGMAFESTLSNTELTTASASRSRFGGSRRALAMSTVVASQLESTIASASTPPSSSSSSGFSSSGSSGGGGGGGGGGGW